MRQGELLSLQWNDVNLERQLVSIGAGDTKSSKGRAVPLNDKALAVIKSLVGNHPASVFTKGGQPMVSIDQVMWKRTCKSAGIENFKFHDLRHTWASNHAISGTPLLVLQKLGGWITLQMVTKYAHLNDDDLSKYASASEVTQTEPPVLRIVSAMA